jgi:hypothetical protein
MGQTLISKVLQNNNNKYFLKNKKNILSHSLIFEIISRVVILKVNRD